MRRWLRAHDWWGEWATVKHAIPFALGGIVALGIVLLVVSV